MINALYLAFLISVSIQSIFLILFLIRFLLHRDSEEQESNIPISVVIATKNGFSNLSKLVDALIAQDYFEYELVIVNDRSTDGTKDYLIELTKSNQKIRAVHIDDKPKNMDGKKYALTLGIKAAQFNHILFTDDDCLPVTERWINKMANSFTSNEIEIVSGVSLYEKKSGFLNSFIQFESLWTAIQQSGFHLLGMPYMAVGRNLAYKKDLFLRNKGFSGYMNTTGGDDDLFVNKHGNNSNMKLCLGKGQPCHVKS